MLGGLAWIYFEFLCYEVGGPTQRWEATTNRNKYERGLVMLIGRLSTIGCG